MGMLQTENNKIEAKLTELDVSGFDAISISFDADVIKQMIGRAVKDCRDAEIPAQAVKNLKVFDSFHISCWGVKNSHKKTKDEWGLSFGLQRTGVIGCCELSRTAKIRFSMLDGKIKATINGLSLSSAI